MNIPKCLANLVNQILTWIFERFFFSSSKELGYYTILYVRVSFDRQQQGVYV